MNENTYFILTLVLSLFLGFFFLFRFLRVLSSSQHVEKITLTREDLEDIKEVLGLLRMKYENSDDDFSKAELRKIEDLRTFFIYISNRPSVLIDALDVYLEKLETENNLCASRDIRLVAILKQQLEGLLSCEDVQIVEM